MSNKGIREQGSKIFNEELAKIETYNVDKDRGRAFRRVVLDRQVAEIGCSMATASSNYNVDIKAAKANPVHALSVRNVGRPEGKNNGGRKKTTPAAAPAASTTPVAQTPDTPVVGDATDSNVLPILVLPDAEPGALIPQLEAPAAEAPQTLDQIMLAMAAEGADEAQDTQADEPAADVEPGLLPEDAPTLDEGLTVEEQAAVQEELAQEQGNEELPA